MEKFNLLRFMNGGDPKMLCMMCKRYDCKKQLCPGDEDANNAESGGYDCPYFQPPSTPINDNKALEVMSDILVYTELDKKDDSDTIREKLEIRREKMERVLIEILKQYGFDKTVNLFNAQGFDAPF